MKWDDLNGDQFDLTGDATGWGINLSTNLKLGEDTWSGPPWSSATGIQNYMNDAPVDVGIERNPANPRTPVVGKALPLLGIVGLHRPQLERRSGRARVGYSMLDIDNTRRADGRRASRRASTRSPTSCTTRRRACSWGRRSSGASARTSATASRRTTSAIQFSAKYNFKLSLGGK